MTGNTPIAGTKAGQILGRTEAGALVFSGVTYGRAERFRPPMPAMPWDGVRDATRLGPRAIQATGADQSFGQAPHDLIAYFAGGDPAVVAREEEHEDENCLVLNVVTPRLDDATRPVLVYVHGGAFDSGSGRPVTWGARLAREQDVVVVGVNHRLNVFGHLHLADLDDAFAGSGNVGMLDLVLALRWLKDNIAAFGGDPSNITLFGESGGGMKISTLLAMPDAVGLFHKAIVQSGPFLTALPREVATQGAERLLATLDAKPADLLAMPARQLFDAWVAARVPMGPVVDGRVLPRPPFEPDAPPTARDVPLLIGNTVDEMSLAVHYVDDDGLARLTPLPEDLRQPLDEAYATSFPVVSSRRRLERIAGDLTFGNATRLQAERKAAQPAPVYRYVTAYAPPILDRALGAFHGMDVPMVLRAVAFPKTEGFSRTVAAAWAAFARTGDPSTSDLAWPRFDVVDRLTMVLDEEPGVLSDPFGGIRNTWGETPLTRGLFDAAGTP
jgi:para-nitrobenzyl esterase